MAKNEGTGWWFDQSAVIEAAERAKLKAESRFAAFVRQRARSSIRKRKKAAAAGQPPSSHTGELKLILFARDAGVTVVGPVRFAAKKGLAPAALEHGAEVPKGATKRRPARTLHYRPHPFMGPALAAEAPRFAELFKGEVR